MTAAPFGRRSSKGRRQLVGAAASRPDTTTKSTFCVHFVFRRISTYCLPSTSSSSLGINRHGKEHVDHLGADCPSGRVDYRRGGILVSLALLASALLASLALLASVVVADSKAPRSFEFRKKPSPCSTVGAILVFKYPRGAAAKGATSISGASGGPYARA
jgi:hypothetical protein